MASMSLFTFELTLNVKRVSFLIGAILQQFEPAKRLRY
jgi:hypothetical protein